MDLARRLVAQWQEALGPDLLGAYLIGSLAHAGFSRRYSDIDLALVTRAGLTAPELDRMRGDATALSAEWGPKISVFWTDRHFSLGRFPPLDRVDYLDHAVALVERECVRPARPSLDDIRQYLRGAPFAAWAERARSFAAADALAPKDHKAYLKALLYPGRFCYSWMTGLIGSNDDAVAFLGEGQVKGLDLDLLENALQCRQSADDPDTLFSSRSVLPSQIDACAALVSG
jgi:predicted nucleotidyltransferase